MQRKETGKVTGLWPREKGTRRKGNLSQVLSRWDVFGLNLLGLSADTINFSWEKTTEKSSNNNGWGNLVEDNSADNLGWENIFLRNEETEK